MHEFNIKESKSENDVKNYKFIYSNTRVFERTPAEEIYFDFKSVSKEGDIEIVKLNCYKNKRKTKITNSLELKIIKSEVNLFPLFRFTCLHPSEFITELNYSSAGLVTSCISEKGTRQCKLIAIEETNLELTIPK